jgi:hypothetical protein
LCVELGRDSVADGLLLRGDFVGLQPYFVVERIETVRGEPTQKLEPFFVVLGLLFKQAEARLQDLVGAAESPRRDQMPHEIVVILRQTDLSQWHGNLLSPLTCPGELANFAKS